MIVVYRICRACGRRFAQDHAVGDELEAICPDCFPNKLGLQR